MSRWIVKQIEDDLEPRPAVYVIYDKRHGLLYVGETSNLSARFEQHAFIVARYSLAYTCHSWKDFPFLDVWIKVKYSTRFGQEAMTERRLIRRLKPRLNVRGLIRLRKLAHG